MAEFLPKPVENWFQNRGWRPHAHQISLLRAAAVDESALLIAPTGGGKTLAGFLPSIADLIRRDLPDGLHTLYISPLKALAVDIHRNLEAPLAEMGLAITAETRTGDTPAKKRARQKSQPPHFLLTTPESLALLLSYPEAPDLFGGLRAVIVDELHALADNKRGDLLALGLSRLQALAPGLRRVGLSATVADRAALARWLSPSAGRDDDVRLVIGRGGVKPDIRIMTPEGRMPWSGHMALYAVEPIYQALRDHRTSIVFVNTRAQAELIFQALWHINADNLPIALHHGSLSAEQRRKVEAAMARGALRAVVATSSLDLGIDWGDVDLVLQVGAPKGVSRLLQRIGRANHRLGEPSKAILVPANRFELLECQAALDAIEAGQLDGPPPQPGGLDVLAQHVVGMACSGPFHPDALYGEVTRAGPYAGLDRRDFDDVVGFVATGGYALGEYERYRRLRPAGGGRLGIAHQRFARAYRMNIGTIVESPTLKVRVGGRVVGEVEEIFVQGLVPGDTFMFAGQVLEFLGVRETMVATRRASGEAPKVPAYGGGRLPLTTHLADGVRAILADPRRWQGMPADVLEWLRVQRWKSVLPKRDGLLVETFPRGGKYYTVAYCFEGRNAHQTLGMLLTRRMQRAGLGPLGFVATDYVIAVWSLAEPRDLKALFAEDMLGDDLEEWMAESSLLKRTFRNVAVIAGLIERRHPGQEKTRKQVTFNADLIYDVLRRHEPDHLLLRATRRDAARGLTDIGRLGELLARARGRIDWRRLDRVSPLAVPVLLEVGRESVYDHAALDQLLREVEVEDADALIAEAMAGDGDQALLAL
ncbi:MAG: ligase-associated DNA damage response DEXH box helicase [Alphaproteobacteria bacterium]|nr:ligase-associated DNA damage response DEXH box helicase [Alphaproteobacteria bacterium]MCB9931745.1 ligase-associated DNA damage response DEXH box helicase [Alphaproteobacteria bacterium]